MKINKRTLSILATIIAVAAALYLRPPEAETTSCHLQSAIESQSSDVQVEGQGTILKVLPDDLHGSRHQRLIVRLPGGDTILIAHNIDLAPRIPEPKAGDPIQFYGEYEWNAKGGVVHWTHHDPAGRHPGGWLKHKGSKYE